MTSGMTETSVDSRRRGILGGLAGRNARLTRRAEGRSSN
jgi:hypothetical protein